MAEEHIRVLVQVRENFVRKRREMAEQMVPEGAAAAHFAPSFVDLQDAIEAIDRAIEDEARQLNPGSTEGPAGKPGAGANENVVAVDFDPDAEPR